MLQQLQKICAKAQLCSTIIKCPYRVKQGVREFCSAASYSVGVHVSHRITSSSTKQKYHCTHAGAVAELPKEQQQSNSGMEKVTSHLPSRHRIACLEQRQNQSPVYFVSRYNSAFFLTGDMWWCWWYTLLLDWSQMPDPPAVRGSLPDQGACAPAPCSPAAHILFSPLI